MTRQMLTNFAYGYDPAMEHYRQTSRLGHHIQQERTFTRPNPRTDPLGGRQNLTGTTHPNTLQSNGAGGPPRRRIPVACGRCRKRKIRCSGDPGDNTGCTNCKTAMIAQGQCIFLRVSSSNIELSPYSSSASSTPTNSSAFAFGLPHASLSTSALHTTLASQPAMRISSHGISGITSSSSMKSPYISETLMGTEGNNNILLGTRTPYDNLSNDIGNPSGVPTGTDHSFPHYMLPSSDSTGGLADHSSVQTLIGHSQNDFLRPWPHISNNGRTGHGNSGFFVDHESSHGLSSVGSTISTYIPSSNPRNNQIGTSIDSYPVTFPALASLSSSLPESLSRTSEKSLPLLPPMSARIQSNDFKERNSLSGAEDGSASQNNYVPPSMSSSISRNCTGLGSSAPSYTTSPQLHLTSSNSPPLNTAGLINSNGNQYITSSMNHNQQTILSSPVDPISHLSSVMHRTKSEDCESVGPSHKILTPIALDTTSWANLNHTSGESRRTSALNKVY